MFEIFRKLYRLTIRACAEILFPESCAGCNKKDTALCFSCKNSIPYFSGNTEEPWISALAPYQNETIHRTIKRAKYKRRPEALIAFGSLLADRIQEETMHEVVLSPVHWFVIPIPITKNHLLIRGYNQSELLAQSALRRLSPEAYSFAQFLHRKNNSKSQVELARKKDRLKNPLNTFIVSLDDRICNSRIVLIDDVVTTGATLREARRVLCNAGAKEVIAVTLAYTERQ